jgi:hypothetical protein
MRTVTHPTLDDNKQMAPSIVAGPAPGHFFLLIDVENMPELSQSLRSVRGRINQTPSVGTSEAMTLCKFHCAICTMYRMA